MTLQSWYGALRWLFYRHCSGTTVLPTGALLLKLWLAGFPFVIDSGTCTYSFILLFVAFASSISFHFLHFRFSLSLSCFAWLPVDFRVMELLAVMCVGVIDHMIVTTHRPSLLCSTPSGTANGSMVNSFLRLVLRGDARGVCDVRNELMCNTAFGAGIKQWRSWDGSSATNSLKIFSQTNSSYVQGFKEVGYERRLD